MYIDTLLDPVRDAAQLLWDYHRVGIAHPVGQYDLLLVTGSYDLGVADRASELVLNPELSFRSVVISGGVGHVTSHEFAQSEASVFAARMFARGVPTDVVWLEERATNTAENITNTKAMLSEVGVRIGRGLLVTKPYMERRMLATADKQWPEVSWDVTSVQVSLADYLSIVTNPRRALSIMVGDTQRIRVYGNAGYLVPQPMPKAVLDAADTMFAAGFDQFVVT